MDHLKAALELSPAVQHLQEGCTRLGLNENMAVELVAFLHLKRRFMPGDDEPNSLMCSSRLNQLWQWMLLNTKVAREVHSLIGGEVDHASTDEEDLPDNTKVVRRLAALNLLAGLGWAPALGFWEEPGTLLHPIQRITHGPQQVPLYIHSGASRALRGTLAGLVQEAAARLLPSGDLWGAVTARSYTAGEGVPEAASAAGSGRKRKAAASRDQTGQKHHQPASVKAEPAAAEPQPRVQIILRFYPTGASSGWQRVERSTVTVTFMPDNNIGDLYWRAARLMSVVSASPAQDPAAVRKLRLFYRGGHLSDKAASLSAAGMEGTSVVHVLQPGQKLPPSFTVVIKTLFGKTIVLPDVTSYTLVQQVKLKVLETEGFPVDQQRLVYEGMQLRDDLELWQYQLEKQVTLHLTLKLRGC